MSKPAITTSENEQVAALCQRNRVRRLTWLYEPLRTGPDAGSDAMLVEFNPADVPSLSALAAMEDEVGRILGRKIDLHLYLREMYLGYGPGEAGILYDRADHIEVPMPKDKIAEFCKRKKIRWLAKLPYPSRESVNNYADVSFLAEFEPGVKVGWDIFTMGDELGKVLGCLTSIERAGPRDSDWVAEFKKTAQVQYERPH